MASAVPAWLDFKETDDHFKKGIKLAATKMIIHQLAEGQDGPQARGDAVQQITSTDADGNEQNIWVESTEGGDVTYIGSEQHRHCGLGARSPVRRHNSFSRWRMRGVWVWRAV